MPRNGPEAAEEMLLTAARRRCGEEKKQRGEWVKTGGFNQDTYKRCMRWDVGNRQGSYPALGNFGESMPRWEIKKGSRGLEPFLQCPL